MPSVAIRVTNEPYLSPQGPQLCRVGAGVGRKGGNKDEGDIDGWGRGRACPRVGEGGFKADDSEGEERERRGWGSQRMGVPRIPAFPPISMYSGPFCSHILKSLTPSIVRNSYLFMGFGRRPPKSQIPGLSGVP